MEVSELPPVAMVTRIPAYDFGRRRTHFKDTVSMAGELMVTRDNQGEVVVCVRGMQ